MASINDSVQDFIEFAENVTVSNEELKAEIEEQIGGVLNGEY